MAQRQYDDFCATAVIGFSGRPAILVRGSKAKHNHDCGYPEILLLHRQLSHRDIVELWEEQITQQTA
jgi:hypothetical protein